MEDPSRIFDGFNQVGPPCPVCGTKADQPTVLVPICITVHPSLGVTDLAGLIALLKAHDAGLVVLAFGVFGLVTTPSLGSALWNGVVCHF